MPKSIEDGAPVLSILQSPEEDFGVGSGGGASKRIAVSVEGVEFDERGFLRMAVVDSAEELNRADLASTFFPQILESVRRQVNDILREDDHIAETLRRLDLGLGAGYFLEALRSRVAYVVSSFVLENLAMMATALQIDALTKLPTQTAFRRAMPHYFEKLTKEGHNLCFVRVDIDYFKPINEKFTHEGGDYVLGKVAHILSKKIKRGVDIIARDGGEEIVLVLVGVPEGLAEKRVEELRKCLEEEDFNWNGVSFGVSATFGMSNRLKGERSYLLAYERANRALNFGKNGGGRNCVVVQKPIVDSSVEGLVTGDMSEVFSSSRHARPSNAVWVRGPYVEFTTSDFGDVLRDMAFAVSIDPDSDDEAFDPALILDDPAKKN